MKRDLTRGNVTGSLLIFAGPMILGNLLQQLYNIVDTWVVGKYVGADALAAAGSAYSLMTFLTSILIGLCMGSGALLSFYRGRRDAEKFGNVLQASFVLIGLICVGLNLAVYAFLNPILRFLRIPGELFEPMRGYVRIVFLGIFFVFLYNFFAFVLRSVGNSLAPLVFLGLAAAVNVVLDLVFVLIFAAGLEGAAWATVMAQAFSGLGLAFYTRLREPSLRFSPGAFRRGGKPIREILQFSLTTSVQQSVMNFGILMIQGLVNSFGTEVMAAFAAAVKIDTFAYMPAQEFGNAFSVFISQNYGAGERERLKKGIKSASAVSAGFCLSVSAAVFCAAEELMKIFVRESETQIIEIGMGYLRIEGAFYLGIGILFLLYGYYRGVNRPEISLLLTVISLGTRVALAYLLAAIPEIGLYGIWWAIPIGWALADVTGILLIGRKTTDIDWKTGA
ncbi:MAG: MATE family efflux transporter [bacterium]|nr:MATE family efflux transporter [bacterium]